MPDNTVPVDIGPAGRDLLARVGGWYADQGMEPEEHEVILLHAAARHADRLVAIRAALDGADLSEGWATRLLAEERQQVAAQASLLVTRLGLPTGVADARGVGSTPRSRRGQQAAIMRWDRRRGPA
jgi:hypothetical protein